MKTQSTVSGFCHAQNRVCSAIDYSEYRYTTGYNLNLTQSLNDIEILLKRSLFSVNDAEIQFVVGDDSNGNVHHPNALKPMRKQATARVDDMCHFSEAPSGQSATVKVLFLLFSKERNALLALIVFHC